MNKKLISLLFTAVMVLGVMTGIVIFPFTSLSAELSDTARIITIDYEKSSTGTNVYNITATILGQSDLSGAAFILGDNSTLMPYTNSGKTDTLDYMGVYVEDSLKDVSNGYELKVLFKNLKTESKDNNIEFTVYSADGNITLNKKFVIAGVRGSTEDGSGDGDTSSDDDKPIAALKPHLIVDGYSYGQAVAGQDVPLTFTLKNTSKSKIMRNIVLNVKPAGDLRIKSSSDTIYIDSVDPGETITKTVLFALGAAAKEEVQVVGLTSTFEYFDIEGENAAQGGDTVSISIPTDTLERVKIQKVELPEMLYPNMEEEIAYSIINSGFSTLYNAEIKVVDEAGTEYADVYVGSIEPSKAVTEPYLPIILPEAGEKNLKFVLTYENDKLQTQEVTKDFKATVMEMPMEKPPIFEEPMPGESLPGEEGKAPWLMWAIIGGGALVVIIVLVIVIKVVRKKRREREDEDI